MKLITKTLLALVLTLFSVPGQTWASMPADELVRETSERMLTALKNEHDALKANPAKLYALTEEIILPHFDFERISSWVLGKYWREATPEQKNRFTQEFRNLLVRTYATAMLEYSGQEIKYLPFKADAGANTVTVRTEVVQPGGPAIPINYSLFVKEGEWKVYDVVVENTSLVASYRSSFANEIRQSGLDALIEKLASRSNQQSGKSAVAE
ncbi:MAG: ABC transporter substrate-binding protein [Gammaproteobacteria bacterium]|nr:ABC transporter substrate-binding protein [Gammaproteobacteria bacterium]